MSTLLRMEANDVEALGSRAPDATVILLITESTQITGLWTAHCSHLTGGLSCAWASVYERDIQQINRHKSIEENRRKV